MIECRDLGITVVSNLSPTSHFTEIVAKAHQRANIILRCFTSGDINVLVRAFTVYLRPIVEHNSVIWSPGLKHDIDLIEKVQRRFTKRLYGLKCLSYADRLSKLGLCSLELRRLHLDPIFCYKIVFGMVNISFNDLSHLARSQKQGVTCMEDYKLYKPQTTKTARICRESYKCVELSTPCCRFFVIGMF